MHEFTKLEKQMFVSIVACLVLAEVVFLYISKKIIAFLFQDESLLEDNKALREEVRRLRDENDSLQDVKKHLQDLELNDQNSHDLQILLMDTTK